MIGASEDHVIMDSTINGEWTRYLCPVVLYGHLYGEKVVPLLYIQDSVISVCCVLMWCTVHDDWNNLLIGMPRGGARGVYRSELFAGLWLAVEALSCMEGDQLSCPLLEISV